MSSHCDVEPLSHRDSAVETQNPKLTKLRSRNSEAGTQKHVSRQSRVTGVPAFGLAHIKLPKSKRGRRPTECAAATSPRSVAPLPRTHQLLSVAATSRPERSEKMFYAMLLDQVETQQPLAGASAVRCTGWGIIRPAEIPALLAQTTFSAAEDAA